MSQKTKPVAIAIVHGLGTQEEDFHKPAEKKITTAFCKKIARHARHPERELVVKPVYWAPTLQRAEDLLGYRLRKSGRLDFRRARDFMVDFLADAIAYQPLPGEQQAYADIHQVYAQALSYLAKEAGEDAPLVILSHSLGTIISSNYLYDLQMAARRNLIPATVRPVMCDTPLERGETLTSLYTVGSPIALWSLRYTDYGVPIQVPGPLLTRHYPNLGGGWFNIYDKDDVIGFPLKGLNTAYEKAVTADWQVNVGRWWLSWTPLAHSGYFTDKAVVEHISHSLALIWESINGRSISERFRNTSV